jgi:hypothetical protein
MTAIAPSVVFDCNVFDEIARDKAGQRRIQEMVTNGALIVLIPPTLRDELANSPFRGVPAWFRSQPVPDSVFILDHSHLDEACLGDGQIYTRTVETHARFRTPCSPTSRMFTPSSS